MSDQVFILLGQNRDVGGRLSLFSYYLVKKNRPTLPDDKQLFAALRNIFCWTKCRQDIPTVFHATED